jgi:hypothetical protein
MGKICRHDVVPVILAALVEHVPNAFPVPKTVRIVDVLELKPTRSVTQDVSDDVKRKDLRVQRQRLARKRYR